MSAEPGSGPEGADLEPVVTVQVLFCLCLPHPPATSCPCPTCHFSPSTVLCRPDPSLPPSTILPPGPFLSLRGRRRTPPHLCRTAALPSRFAHVCTSPTIATLVPHHLSRSPDKQFPRACSVSTSKVRSLPSSLCPNLQFWDFLGSCLHCGERASRCPLPTPASRTVPPHRCPQRPAALTRISASLPGSCCTALPAPAGTMFVRSAGTQLLTPTTQHC